MQDIERLTAIEEIRRLMARYVRYADHQRWRDMAGLFTEDATFTALMPDDSVRVAMGGREEIATKIAAAAGPGDVFIHHLYSDEIDVASADSATGVFNMDDKIIRAEREPGEVHGLPSEQGWSRLEGYGHYRIRFTRVDGAWYIAELVQSRLHFDYDH